MHTPLPVPRMESERFYSCMPCDTPVKNGERKRFQGKMHSLKKNEDDEYECNYCDYVSKKSTTMSEHITRKHAAEAGRQVNPFACSYCETRFVSKTALSHHVKNHHEISYTKCPIDGCRHMSKTKQSLCAHVVSKHLLVVTVMREIGDDMCECMSCFKKMKKHGIAYHASKCNPRSPFFEGSRMCDDAADNELIVYRGRKLTC